MRRSRIPFSLRFFLLALLFLVFDLEIILLFPYVFRVSITRIKIKVIRKLWGFIFLVILVGGLVHELNEGTLD
jgi:NADH-ubiquinone oxidoreductase chain 3